MPHYLLAIDQGTTNSRAIIFDREGRVIAQHDMPLTLSFPQDGWVEQDPIEMFTHTVTCCQQALRKANLRAQDIAGIGISNQRETTIIWDKNTGAPIYPAIVWQDRRTSEFCKQLAQTPLQELVRTHTGLILDSYFSATKINWILDNVPNARERALRGELLFGTVDTFLIWKLTKQQAHVTDATNASRTMIFNIHTQQWDDEILSHLKIPKSLLPTVLDCAAHFGNVDSEILGAAIPIAGVAGDQQAATIGQTCFHPGMIKATYGTGCFLVLNTGKQAILSQNNLITTIAYRLNNQTTYALEGSIFSAGNIIKWLRDKMKYIATADESELFARRVADTGDVYLVPAFTGLGAPHWDPDARGALLGLTQNTSPEHIVRAALESVAYQTRDLLNAMSQDSQTPLTNLRVDGGMVVNNWFLEFLSGMLNLEVQRASCIETSALGVAYLAGLQIGMYQSLDELQQLWRMDRAFFPMMENDVREKLYANWGRAVKRVLTVKS